MHTARGNTDEISKARTRLTTQRPRRTPTLGIKHTAVDQGTCVPHCPKPKHACVRPGGNALLCDKGGSAPRTCICPCTSCTLETACLRWLGFYQHSPAKGQAPAHMMTLIAAQNGGEKRAKQGALMRYAGPASARNQGPPITAKVPSACRRSSGWSGWMSRAHASLRRLHCALRPRDAKLWRQCQNCAVA